MQTKRAILASRLLAPPKNACPCCLVSLSNAAACRAHIPCPNYKWVGCWIKRTSFLPHVAALHNRLTALEAYPTLKRSSDPKEQANTVFKVRQRVEMADKLGRYHSRDDEVGACMDELRDYCGLNRRSV